ncbi:pyridine nucleotide-disulfide oxidoreductase domain-containing protein 1 [Teleopsis dalmanni]|uniref:pyridine nucleotide-disulfide oxidoreductase domain-containing protein 1 n=1 Tax=Teleopsis dalmanni TaxID=139649 RepID=UPI000D32C086|nr:pyridine nucleotide-disulfide oxidoreductase domain-containing protein 1 [Teleopsis dalmanni]
MEEHAVTFLVVGGGIAGVTCAETLAICCPEEKTLLLTESNVIKTVANLEPVARYLHKFDILERQASENGEHILAPCVVTFVDQLQHIDSVTKRVLTRGNRSIKYKYLCLCTGGRPHLIMKDNPRVIGIRDTDSVLELQRQLVDAKTIVIVGNGGIASELASELDGVTVHWVIKDEHISSTFVDPGAAHFFQQKGQDSATGDENKDKPTSVVKRLRYGEMQPQKEITCKIGAALGPDWHRNFQLKGGLKTPADSPIIHYKTQVKKISNEEESLLVELSEGESIHCDFVISATGVDPRHDFTCDQQLTFAHDGGINVNAMMETNLPDIYAAGDACTAGWEIAAHWFQMRLWTQARQMGAMAGRSMAAAYQQEKIYQDFCFELFGHVTQLFGYQVVLLGLYNGQGLNNDYEILLRTTPGKEYIKFVLQNGKLRGAILIGNSELAETCENLILNGIDLTPFGDDILNPDIDIEDYFD